MKKHIGSFQAVDAAGKAYTIDHYQEYSSSRLINGKIDIATGMESHAFGHYEVLFLGDNTFYITGLETEVKKID